jgi:transcriptional regulator with XRE-family HTH domain
MSNEVGSRLKEVRRELKTTQEQLEEKLGIKGTLNNIDIDDLREIIYLAP